MIVAGESIRSVTGTHPFPPLKKGGKGGFRCCATIPISSIRRYLALQHYGCRTRAMGAAPPQASLRFTVLPAKADRQLHRRFLRTEGTARDRDRRVATPE